MIHYIVGYAHLPHMYNPFAIVVPNTTTTICLALLRQLIHLASNVCMGGFVIKESLSLQGPYNHRYLVHNIMTICMLYVCIYTGRARWLSPKHYVRPASERLPCPVGNVYIILNFGQLTLFVSTNTTWFHTWNPMWLGYCIMVGKPTIFHSTKKAIQGCISRGTVQWTLPLETTRYLDLFIYCCWPDTS